MDKLLLVFVLITIFSCDNSNIIKKNLNADGVDKTKTLTEKKVKLQSNKIPMELLLGIFKSGFIERDSGKEINISFLDGCLKEQTGAFYLFSCNDLTFDIQAVRLSKIDPTYYLIENGASVENRLLFKVSDEVVQILENKLEKIFTEKKMAELINKKFSIDSYTEGYIKSVAHSHFRSVLPKKEGGNIVITSGELKYGTDHGYKPLAEVAWKGGEFQLIPLKLK